MARKARFSTICAKPFLMNRSSTKSESALTSAYHTPSRSPEIFRFVFVTAPYDNCLRRSNAAACDSPSKTAMNTTGRDLRGMAPLRRPSRHFCSSDLFRLAVELGIVLCLITTGQLQQIHALHAHESDHIEKTWDKAFRPSVIAPLGVSPGEEIHKITFLPGDDRLLTSTAGGRIMVWDVPNKCPVMTIRGPFADIDSLSVSSNGRLLAEGARQLYLYDMETWKLIDRFGWPENSEYRGVGSALLFPDGSRVLLWETSGVSILDLRTKRKRQLDIADALPIPQLAIDPTGRYVLIGRRLTRDALLYDLDRDRVASRFGQIFHLSDRAFSADGKYVALTTINGTAEVRTVPSGNLVARYPSTALAWSPQGHKLAVLRRQHSSAEGELYVIDIVDVDSDGRIATVGPVTQGTLDVAFSPTCKFLATSDETEVIVWDLDRKERLFSSTSRHALMPSGIWTSTQDDGVLLLSYLSEPHYANYRRTLCLWNHNVGQRLWMSDSLRGILGISAVHRKDGHWIAAGTMASHIVLVQLTGDFQITRLTDVKPGSYGEIICTNDGAKCAIIYYSRTYASGEIFLPGKIEIWDAKKSQLLLSLSGLPVSCATFDNSGEWLFAGYGDGTIRKWKVDTGQLGSTYQGGEGIVREICVSAAGGRMLSRSSIGERFSTRVLLWDMNKDQPVMELPSSFCAQIELSGDGKIAATGSWDGTISLWDCSSRSQIAVWRAHDAGVSSIRFLAGAARLASTGYDGRCLIWSIPHGREIASLWHTPNSGWFCSTPEGYFDYDGDEATLSYIRHVDLRTLRLLSPEESRKYYRPEVVRRALARQAGD